MTFGQLVVSLAFLCGLFVFAVLFPRLLKVVVWLVALGVVALIVFNNFIAR